MTGTSLDALDMNLLSTTVLWEGASSDLTNKTTGGKVVRAGKMTEDAIYFAFGMWAVRDGDLAQGMTRRARGGGDLTLKMDGQAARRLRAAGAGAQSDQGLRERPDHHPHQGRYHAAALERPGTSA
jgi:hypothetical protein